MQSRVIGESEHFHFDSTLFSIVQWIHCVEMADILNNSQQLGAEKYPRKSEKLIQYGTSGFRTKYDAY